MQKYLIPLPRRQVHLNTNIQQDVLGHTLRLTFSLIVCIVDLENKLMGPIFASQKTGAALLQEGNNGEYQADDTMEAVCNDTTNNSTSVISCVCGITLCVVSHSTQSDVNLLSETCPSLNTDHFKCLF
jgi:hypothetical protein